MATILVMVLLGVFVNSQFVALNRGKNFYELTKDFEKDDRFRRLRLSEKNYEYLKALSKEDTELLSEYIASMMLVHKYDLDGNSALKFSKRKLDNLSKRQKSLKEDNYEKIAASYQAVFADMEVFPVAVLEDKKATWSYVDSWGFERSYGGKRTHEGCDIMADIDESELYPVVSATDGIVEKIGWLEKGGYRIGIRSPSGGYFYYAHLSSYGKDFQIGEKVQAGQFLGYMGDTGYGPEGTTGQFPVHLHFGIYFNNEAGEEVSVNPFFFLKISEKQKVFARFPGQFVE